MPHLELVQFPAQHHVFERPMVGKGLSEESAGFKDDVAWERHVHMITPSIPSEGSSLSWLGWTKG